MGKVVFSGHGGFETATNPPWVTVPPATTVYFYSDNMKALLDSNGHSVETMSAALDVAPPSQVVCAGERCPNYTLYDPEDLDIQSAPDGVTQVVVGPQRTLESLLAEYAGNDCYWAACRVVDLNEVGGAYLGVNDDQEALGGGDSAGGQAMTAMQVWLDWFSDATEEERLASWQRKSPEWQNGARLNDENVRQWAAAHTAAGSGVLTDEEMDGFVQWWSSAGEGERNNAWAELSDPQRQQVSDRIAALSAAQAAGPKAAVAANWLPDPLDASRYRWWDGTRWTAQVAHGGETAEDAAGAAALAGQAAGR